jgi:hypothetical protein
MTLGSARLHKVLVFLICIGNCSRGYPMISGDARYELRAGLSAGLVQSSRVTWHDAPVDGRAGVDSNSGG